MRVDAKWSASEVALWLIAAIVATLVVCNQGPSPEGDLPSPSDPPSQIDFEVEITD